jgi:hypothetical protein
MLSKAGAVLAGGAVAGAIDITYAIVYSYLRARVAPMTLLQYVASGLVGPGAFKGGTPMAALGLALHFFIAFSAAAIYVAAAQALPVLTHRPLLCGVPYGVLIFAFMNLVVIPLSRTQPRTSISMLTLSTGLLIHMVGIGLPIALAARRAFAGQIMN